MLILLRSRSRFCEGFFRTPLKALRASTIERTNRVEELSQIAKIIACAGHRGGLMP